MSLRQQVFMFLDNNNVSDVTRLLKVFPDGNKKSVRRYFYDHKKLNESDITNDIELINLDTIKEMEIAIQQIKDPVKRCENLSRLHQMKLKPLQNKEEKSLKELLDG
jgi:hypothetical protein